MSEDDRRDVLDSREMCALFGLGRNELFALANSNQGFPQPFKPGRKKYYWLRSEVLAYQQKQQIKGADDGR